MIYEIKLKVVIALLILMELCWIDCYDIYGRYTWSGWSNWPMSCSTTCLAGVRCRIRKCTDSRGKQFELKKCGDIKNSKDCQKCISKGICPIDAHWNDWKAWSPCYIKGYKDCGKGTRSRVRMCDNPKPKHDGMHCIGNSTEREICVINCDQKLELKAEIEQVINEHFKTLANNIKIKKTGDSLRLNCDTVAYISALISQKKMYVIWHFNGIALRTLQDIMLQEVLALQLRLQRQMGIPQPNIQLPTAHIQFSGNNLIIKSLLTNDSGVFTCVINYDRRDYVTTFYTVTVDQQEQSTPEFHNYLFKSNTEGLERVQILDSAEIRWFMNRKLKFTGLLNSINKRYFDRFINKTHQGYWSCFLYLDYRSDEKYWLVNSFDLKVTQPESTWLKLSKNSNGKYYCYMMIVGILINIVVFMASFIVTKLRVNNWLDSNKKAAIVQEEMDNYRMMLMIARKKAAIRTEELLEQVGWKEKDEENENVDEDDEEDD